LSRKFSARELAEVGSRLIESGRVDVGLELVDVGWRYSSDYAGNESMFQHALVSARTNLDLGRYSAVDEPLTAAERFAASNPAEMVQVVLLRMKLALRRNAYAVLFALFEQVLVLTSDDAISRIEAEIMLNAAWRDTNDLPKLQESVKRISLSCDSHPPSLQCSIDRALARSLVKLGSYDEAMLRAYSALSLSKASPYVRDIGTAHFACAEVRRYRKEFPAAVEHYEAAAGIGRATGNRDLLLWSLLGEAAAHVEARGVDRAVSPLGEVAALLNEPGYEHPLERAHESLLRLLSDGNVEKAVIVRSYAALKIYWPADFIAAVERTGEVTEAIPL
jgi:tetratricopeptide (TPR) repeat protein